MNLKNLKVFNMPKAKTKLCALALAGTLMITYLTGCSGKNSKNLLEGTLLNNCVVTEIDGTMTILKKNYSSGHYHYTDIVGGILYTDANACQDDRYIKMSSPQFDSIVDYLTEDELKKASAGELTREDIVGIVYRINTLAIENDTENSLTLTP